jgi:hypothetical protein
LVRIAADAGFSVDISTTAEGSARFYGVSQAIRDGVENACQAPVGMRAWGFDLMASLAVLAGRDVGDVVLLHGVEP